jgi:tripartite-type tricarboxylate transporter receptor subunit TctC
VVRADAPWKTLPELLAYARANPNKLNYGTLGIGSTQHLAAERIRLTNDLTRLSHLAGRGACKPLIYLGRSGAKSTCGAKAGR